MQLQANQTVLMVLFHATTKGNKFIFHGSL